MSVVTYAKCTIRCDGCGAKLSGEHRNGLEARAAGWQLGWRFPNRVRVSGEPATLTNDVCPDCIDDWKPRPAPPSGRDYRAHS
jgi:hypothetical protein